MCSAEDDLRRSHPISVALIRVIQRSSETSVAKAHVSIRRCARIATSMGMWGSHAGVVRRIVLQDVSINRTPLETVQLRSHVRMTVRALPLHSVDATLGSVDISHGTAGVNVLCEVPPSSRGVTNTKGLVADVHVDHSLMAVVSSSEAVQLLALKLVLDAFAVGSVAYQWQHRPNSLDKQSALSRFRIIQSSLDTVVAVRIAQQFLKTGTIE